MNKNIKNYDDAKAYLGNKKERPYANNTRIEADTLNMGHEVISVKYHGNVVVNFFPDGTNSYSSCGWKTLTTKERINWFLPDGFQLWQEKSVWYLSDRNTHTRYIFADGIAIKNGDVYNAGEETEFEETKKQIKAIKKYVEGFYQALIKGEVPQPSGGDCWFCCMGDENGNPMDAGIHIQYHIEEDYYIPSLLVNAEKYKNMSQMAKGVIGNIWQDKLPTSKWELDILHRDFVSSLTAYLKHELNIAQ